MSFPDADYPPPRYAGAAGETSAIVRPHDHAPDLTYPNGTRVHYLATRVSTEGLFGLYRYEMAGAAGGPGPHFHRTITESFYVLSGTIQLFDGTEWRDGRPGDFVHVPEGGIHGFRNASSEPASMLIHFAPGAAREDYFETLARVAGGLELTDEEKASFYLRHDNHWV